MPPQSAGLVPTYESRSVYSGLFSFSFFFSIWYSLAFLFPLYFFTFPSSLSMREKLDRILCAACPNFVRNPRRWFQWSQDSWAEFRMGWLRLRIRGEGKGISTTAGQISNTLVLKQTQAELPNDMFILVLCLCWDKPPPKNMQDKVLSGQNKTCGLNAWWLWRQNKFF